MNVVRIAVPVPQLAEHANVATVNSQSAAAGAISQASPAKPFEQESAQYEPTVIPATWSTRPGRLRQLGKPSGLPTWQITPAK